LDPVLEAVAELPEGGLPIPSSAEIRVRQFFQHQIQPVMGDGGMQTDVFDRHKAVDLQPADAQTIQQVQDFLHNFTVDTWGSAELSHVYPAAHAAVQLLGDTARFVARQQVVERGSLAYIVLLRQTYRAGGWHALVTPGG
jgi:hypothetical protein